MKSEEDRPTDIPNWFLHNKKNIKRYSPIIVSEFRWTHTTDADEIEFQRQRNVEQEKDERATPVIKRIHSISLPYCSAAAAAVCV